MFLGNSHLQNMVWAGVVTPVNPKDIQPCSIDLHLRLPDNKSEYHNSSEYHLFPSEFLLVACEEVFNIPPTLGGLVVGVSTVARQGLSVESAGLVDPGFVGRVTLELYNMGAETIILQEGCRIAQLMLFEVVGCDKPYTGRYQHDMEATHAKAQ